MNNPERVISNTIILYFKILLNMLISLATVPLIFNALGTSDYGLYNLIAGVVSMLAFLNASLTVSTQRYLSVAIGRQGEEDLLNRIFNGAIYLHLVLAVIIILLLEVVGLFLFDGLLNIEEGRVTAAKTIYQFLIISILFTILLVPYNAALNAKENMLVFSIIGIVEALLRLILAFLLYTTVSDKLIFYGAGMALITFMIFTITLIYVAYSYPDFRFSFKKTGKSIVMEMAGFSGWNALGAFAVISRNQGTAIVINIFHGTIANAAYGIANQFNGVVNYFSSTFQKSINPQLMQSEGMGNRERLIRISYVSCKYSTLVYSIVAVPLILEMDYILYLWLGESPKFAAGMSQLILFFGIVNQMSSGLMSAIQAIGNIKKYFIVISIVIFVNVPICYELLYLGYSPVLCIGSFVVLEIIALLIRIKMSVTNVGISALDFIKKVILPIVITIVSPLFLVVSVLFIIPPSFVRLSFTVLLYSLIFVILAWNICLGESEKNNFKNFLSKIKFDKINKLNTK